MGRKPKSDEEKELSGAYAKNPQRRPKPSAAGSVICKLGKPPASFQNRAWTLQLNEAWKEVKALAKAQGFQLTEAHRLKAEALARAMVIMRWSEKTSDCSNVLAAEKELFGKVPTKREVEKAVENTEDDREWNRLATPPAPPATRVQ